MYIYIYIYLVFVVCVTCFSVLQILAAANTDDTKPLVGVDAIVTAHWKEYGRNYYA